VTPPGCQLITVDSTTKNYELLMEMVVGVGNPALANGYLHAQDGGILYDWTTNEFTFIKAPEVDFGPLIRSIRNSELAKSDHLMRVPDLPAELKAQTTAHRQALRDVTNQIKGPDTKIEDIEWPVTPAHH
jgi:hypothetical protein